MTAPRVLSIRTRRLGLLAGLVAAALGGCADAPSPSPGRPGGVRLLIRPTQFEDDRTYSTGRVSLRAFDAADAEIAAAVFPIDRSTGIIDVAFTVPAGSGRRVLVEPLGGGILPDGERTETGVALQGLSDPFDLEVGGEATAEVTLDPFIPDDLVVDTPPGGNRPILIWRAMPPATSHAVRVLERDRDLEDGPIAARDVAVASGNRAFLDELARPGFVSVGYQVRSVNRFSSSALSDTLFFSFDGGGGGGGDGIPPELGAALLNLSTASAAYPPVAEAMVDAAVDYAFLARDLTGSNEPVLTGSLILNGGFEYTYSALPSDRLVVDLGNGQQATYVFAAFSGPDVTSVSAFLDRHDDLDVDIVYAGLADARFESRATRAITGAAVQSTWSIDVTGTLFQAGGLGNAAVRSVKARTVDSAAGTEEASVRLTGSAVSTWGTTTLDERLETRNADVGEGIPEDSFAWTSASSVLVGGIRFGYADFLVRGARLDGVIVDPARWSAAGRLQRDGVTVGSIRFLDAVQQGQEQDPEVVIDVPGTGIIFLATPAD